MVSHEAEGKAVRYQPFPDRKLIRVVVCAAVHRAEPARVCFQIVPRLVSIVSSDIVPCGREHPVIYVRFDIILAITVEGPNFKFGGRR